MCSSLWEKPAFGDAVAAMVGAALGEDKWRIPNDAHDPEH